MIVDTLAEAQQVADYLRESATAIGNGMFDGLTKEEVIDAIRSGNAILAVRAPDAAMLVLREQVHIGPYTEVWAGRWLAGSTQAGFRGVAIDIANALVARGNGGVPVYWSKSSVAGRFLATRLGARSVTRDGASYYWFTAAEGLTLL